jgi:hypothetical protein
MNEVASGSSPAMDNSRFLLGEEWLVTFVRKLDAEGVPEKEITDQVNTWVLAVIKYVLWLGDEGMDAAQSADVVNRAVDEAGFDLERFPKVPGDGS